MKEFPLSLNRRSFAAKCGAVGGASLASGLFLEPWTGQAFGNQATGQSKPVVVEDPYLFLIRQPRVQKELNLRAEQVSAVQQATDEVDGHLFLMRDIPLVQRAERTKPLTARVREKMQQVLSRTQRQRLEQVVAQAQGHRALMGDGLARQLRLTPSQRKELLEIAQETEKEKAKLAEKAKNGGSREDLQKEVTELMRSEQKQFIAAMTATQKPRLSSLFGPTFQVDRNVLPHVKPPKLPLAGPWINSEPLTLDKLKGKVVALHYYAFA